MQNSVMFEGKKGFMPDVIAPKVLYDFIRAIKAPGRAKRGEVLDEEEALNTALNMFGGGLATSGSVPIGALGMSARTAPAGTVPLREIPRSPLGFYSKVEEATLPLQNKGSGGQFLAQIQKTPGVKPEEIEVLGLDKFLQSKPTVTKQEVQDYITANKPDVQEVQLGGKSSKDVAQENLDAFTESVRQRLNTNSFAFDDMTSKELMQYDILNERLMQAKNDVTPTKFAKYTIPGGENYRELLLTLPEKKLPLDEFLESAGKKYGGDTPRNQWSAEDNATYERLLKEDPSVPRGYRSGHYDQPNILTHLRANDRVIDGKKALFIEEIQSDWHQAGRKKGYAQPETKRLTGVVEQEPPSEFGFAPEWKVTWEDGSFSGGYGSAEAAAARAAEGKSNAKVGVPDAPFKKSWHELALKRAIQEAVDKGYDKLAFTTGKTQAERYDLSKQVDSLLYSKNPDGTYRVSAQVQGRGQMMGESIPESDLADYVGKEVAEKMAKGTGKQIQVAGKYDPVSMTSDTKYMTELSGEGLKVGGEGQKGFYDEILPKALQNLTKKYGTKVTKSKLDEGSEVWSMDITPQMREQIASKGQPLFATAPPLGLASQDPLEQFLGYQEAENDPMMQFLGQK